MSFTGKFPRFSKLGSEDKEVYLGDPDVDGSFRLVESGGSIHLEQRVGGSWIDQGDIITAPSIGVNYNVITDDKVDFDATVNFIEITANKTLGAKNTADGKNTIVVVKNTDASSHIVTFDSASFGTNATDSVTAVPSNQHNVYACSGSDASASAVLLKDDVGSSFPTGVDGDLTILNGQTVQLTAGAVKDYANVDIQAGGTLEIIDPSSTGALTEIYVQGTFNIDGQLLGRSMPNGSSASGTTITGFAYSYTIPQNNGGGGGNGYEVTGQTGTRGFGGSQNNGYGGGGGGSAVGNNSTSGGNGGNGATPTGNGSVGGTYNSTIPGVCGAQGTTFGGSGGSGGNGSFFNGQNGQQASAPSASHSSNMTGGAGGAAEGGGAGGGAVAINQIDFLGSCLTNYSGQAGGGGGAGKGSHGSSILLWCASGITGSGSVDLSGTAGGNGGNGANNNEWTYTTLLAPPQQIGGSGGGGGGAGGSGGTLYYKALSFSPSTNVAGGAGGAGGSPGKQEPAGAPTINCTGGAGGSNGTSGSIIVIP